MSTRIERDSMGEMPVPADALYGASTQRAVLNFPVLGRGLSPAMISAYGLIKWAAAEANRDLGLLDGERADLIAQAAQEVFDGKHDGHFPVDVFQTGSGTSTNMNANEVISNRCCQIAGNAIGAKDPVHPNDHVNMGQSSNDTFPTAMHIAVGLGLKDRLIPALEALSTALAEKADAFWDVLKIGRTHLMDATPVRLGQEFRGYARQAHLAAGRARRALDAILELPLGGTAVGTGLNCHPEFPPKAIAFIAAKSGIEFREAEDHFEAQAAKDGLCEASGLLKAIAAGLFKVANDVRWLGSGPRCGIGEIQLPSTQPGSSIMPGKVNPVMSESLMQVCAQVVGNDATVTWCAANGNFELNVMMPSMVEAILSSINLLANAATIFRERCIEGVEANVERCNSLIELSLSMVTSLAPIIGYDRAAEIAKESVKTGRTVRELCEEQNVLPKAELDAALDAASMTAPGA
ncbi:MAG: class II fumarate hydratase [Verrucomicrobiales bacterium]